VRECLGSVHRSGVGCLSHGHDHSFPTQPRTSYVNYALSLPSTTARNKRVPIHENIWARAGIDTPSFLFFLVLFLESGAHCVHHLSQVVKCEIPPRLHPFFPFIFRRKRSTVVIVVVVVVAVVAVHLLLSIA